MAHAVRLGNGLRLGSFFFFFGGRPPIFPHSEKSRGEYFFVRICPPLAPADLKSTLRAAIAVSSASMSSPCRGLACSMCRRKILDASLFVIRFSSVVAV